MVAAVGLTVAACGNSSGGSSSSGAAGFNAALTSVVNPSSSTTGSVVMEESSALQSADPNATYDATDWDVSRLWARTMLAFTEQPGKASNTVTEDLATAPGKSSDNNQTWSYTVRDGAKFSNGDPITAEDVAYAIARSGGWGSTITGGPSYFKEYIVNTNTKAGTLETSAAQVPSLLPSGITVSGQTITFKLNQPVADFDYLMTLPETAPFDVQAGADQGASYALHVISSSSYEIQSYSPTSQMVLVPNPNFSASTDPNNLHKVHASKITLKFNLAQTTVDQDILHGRAAADLAGVGVDTSSQGTVLSNPANKAISDAPVDGFEDYLALNTQVAPLDNLDCRQAIEYAIDKAQVQSVAGGSIGAGQVATTIIPPTVNGYVDTNLYATGGNIGDTAKASGLVNSCKAAEGSKWNPQVNISAFSDQPKNVDMSNTMASELNAIGFQSTVKQFKFSNWGTTIGNFSWEKNNRVLVANAAWGPDFPDGNGYLQFMVGAAGVNFSSNASNYTYWQDATFSNYLKQAEETNDPTARNAIWAKADQYAMQQGVIVPLLYATALDVRAKSATNVYFMDAYGMYDYASIGSTS
jgi:peptide/nickel transport system substrate-binding protein